MPDYSNSHSGWTLLNTDINAGHLELIAPDPSDKRQVDASIAWMTNPKITTYLGVDLGDDPINESSETDRLTEIAADLDEYAWMICLNGKVVGNVGLNAIDDQSQVEGMRAARRVILLDPAVRGQGIAHAVLGMINEWAFTKGGFEVIVSRIKPDNTASLRMSERAGSERFSPDSPNGWIWLRLTKARWTSRNSGQNI